MSQSTPAALNLSWLVRVRWFVWAAQALLLLWASVGLDIHLQLGALAVLVAVGFGSNLAVGAWGGRASEDVILGVMLFDVALHTAVFFLSGGPFNPFTTLYLVNVALGTVVLSRARQWAQVIASSAGFGSLFVLEKLAPESLQLPNHAQLMRLHLAGMLVAFAVASAFIVTFVDRVVSSLRRREVELADARALAAKNEKLAALTTLAAGAAHELATPLGTIALVSKELARALESRDVPQGWRDDAVLVREQVQRCREILQQMSVSSGELAAEGFTRVPVGEWVTLALSGVQDAARVKRPAMETGVVLGPKVAMGQALASLVRNALQAAKSGVELSVKTGSERLVLEVVDDGPGLSPEVARRLGEPFFTTREPGQGMGLGVFLARTLAIQLGGSLDYESSASGTIARLTLPLAGEPK
jgi:two-component system sensor histidine kinase RegB